MYYVFIITLILLGILGASQWMEKTIPPSKGLLDFLKPSEGWIGLVSIVLGLYWFLRILFKLGAMLKYLPVYTFVYLASAVVMVLLGFVLAQTQLRAMAGSNDGATGFINKMVDRFAPLKEKLGLVALGLGVFILILIITR